MKNKILNILWRIFLRVFDADMKKYYDDAYADGRYEGYEIGYDAGYDVGLFQYQEKKWESDL